MTDGAAPGDRDGPGATAADGRAGAPVQAVCFDMDGVLVDSESYWKPLEREEILPRAVPDADVDVDEITGMPYTEIYDYLEEAYGVALSRGEFEALFEEAAVEIFGERADPLPVLPDLLDALAERDVPVALVTSSPHDWIDVVVERFDLDGAFDAVVSAEDLSAPGKPEPHIYERAAELLGVAPERALAVEDSANGLRAADAAGLTVVGFRLDGTPGDGPDDHVAETPADLARLVRSLVDG
jgi:HAD superfamily hydrolase (TIGR01509 family)